MHIILRDVLLGKHVHTRVFMGVNREAPALTGTLILNVGEWQVFGAALLLGAEQMNGQVTITLPDTEEVKRDLAKCG